MNTRNDILNNIIVSGTISTGNIEITNGASDGYVLISDTNGISSWTQSSAIQMSGTNSIIFDRPRVYNTRLSGLTGNISADLTNSRLGIIQKIYHNDSSTPTLSGATWSLLSGTYTPSTLNIIYAEWVTSAEIEYWII